MKLIRDIIERRLEVSKDFSLNNEDLKQVWTFYEIYKICLNVLGREDKQLKNKLTLLRLLIMNPENISYLSKIKDYISEDSQKIELVLDILKENEELKEVVEDFYPISVIGVNYYDR